MPIDRPAISDLLNGVVRRAVISITQAATRAQVDLDAYALAQATSLSAEAVRDLVFGGSTVTASLGESFINRISATIAGAFNQSWQSGMIERQREQTGEDAMYRWTLGATSSGTHCPDCVARAGQVQSLRTWDLVGPPQSGFSVCGSRCKCYLDPVR